MPAVVGLVAAEPAAVGDVAPAAVRLDFGRVAVAAAAAAAAVAVAYEFVGLAVVLLLLLLLPPPPPPLEIQDLLVFEIGVAFVTEGPVGLDSILLDWIVAALPSAGPWHVVAVPLAAVGLVAAVPLAAVGLVAVVARAEPLVAALVVVVAAAGPVAVAYVAVEPVVGLGPARVVSEPIKERCVELLDSLAH